MSENFESEGDILQSTVCIMDIEIASFGMAEAVKTVEKFIETQKPHLIATANAEMLMLAESNEEFKAILQSADLVVPDGAGVVWAAKTLGRPVKERVAGYDLTQELLSIAAQKGYRIYFLGAAPGVALQAKIVAETKYPGLLIVGVRDGYFADKDDITVIDDITKANPHILLAAMGVPRQEHWLYKYRNHLNVPVAMGVGGTFDVMAGIVDRAPLWMQKSGLEWSYRLIKQPRRIFRMMALPKFVIKILTMKK